MRFSALWHGLRARIDRRAVARGGRRVALAAFLALPAPGFAAQSLFGEMLREMADWARERNEPRAPALQDWVPSAPPISPWGATTAGRNVAAVGLDGTWFGRYGERMVIRGDRLALIWGNHRAPTSSELIVRGRHWLVYRPELDQLDRYEFYRFGNQLVLTDGRTTWTYERR
ncbi:MAG: hypothetical protein KDG50_14305 [Chromatiales bacterium]|nr:hypothetical protein [Chromatiales bacterium]